MSLDGFPGIGAWTATLIALRGFGRLDAFPHGDAGVRKILGAVLGYEGALSSQQEQALLDKLGQARGLLYFYAPAWRLAEKGLVGER